MGSADIAESSETSLNQCVDGRLGVFVDGAQVAAVTDESLPGDGLIGLVTFGRTRAKFDSLHLLDLVSNRPLSGPAAY